MPAFAREDSRAVEGLAGSLQAEEQLQELAGDRGHRDRTEHTQFLFPVIVLPVEPVLGDEFEDGLTKHVAQPCASPLGLPFLAPDHAALPGPQVHAGVPPQLPDAAEVAQRSGLGQNPRKQERANNAGDRTQLHLSGLSQMLQ